VSALPPEREAQPDSAIADGRRVRGDLTRARVLQAAVKSASVLGLNGVTMGQLADASGVSKGHLAILFGNREKLQLATLDAAVNLFREHVMIHVEAAPTPEEKLRRYCFGWFDYVKKAVLPGGCLITAATSEFRTIGGSVRDRLIELRARRREYITTLVGAIPEARGRKRATKEVDDFVNTVLAFQAAANVAWFLRDAPAFEHARAKTAEALDKL
jgi:AcrR family transcriptional regulator